MSLQRKGGGIFFFGPQERGTASATLQHAPRRPSNVYNRHIASCSQRPDLILESLHWERVSHQNRSPRRDFRALDLLLESARGAGSKSHATPIGARTTAIHLVNALGGKKVRSRRARDIKLPLAPLSSSHLMTPVPMLPSQVKHLAYYSGAFALTLRRGIEGTLTATERRFFPARRCFFAALTPSVPTAKLSFALCAAFRTAGGRGDAAGLQGMRR